jgi:hypothetical protein
MFDVPYVNTVMPTATHIVKKPILDDEDHDDAGYRFDGMRTSPYDFLNPLKGIKLQINIYFIAHKNASIKQDDVTRY